MLDAVGESEMHECKLLADALSTAYSSTKPFLGSTTAEAKDYLASNGVLLTMCGVGGDLLSANCSLLRAPSPASPHWWNSSGSAVEAQHWSGSWFNAVTGLSLYPGAVVGVIADPHATDLRCIYPTDAGTDKRDGAGCGPLAGDPTFGSEGAARLSPENHAAVRAQIRAHDARMEAAFPGRDWRDSDCAEYFQRGFHIEAQEMARRVAREGARQRAWNKLGPLGDLPAANETLVEIPIDSAIDAGGASLCRQDSPLPLPSIACPLTLPDPI